jgi:mannose-6-phosphate isomerase-like protein (cupin superfamily)
MSEPTAFVVHEDDCPADHWDDPVRGQVSFRTLLSADLTPSDKITLGVAELAPGEARSLSLHRHAPPEAYYILSGTGVVEIEGQTHPVRAGSTVFIPSNARHGAANTGDETLKLLYVFAVDSFSEIEYHFDD